MNILVTGATGFIGNHVIEELLKYDENSIIATSRDIEKAKKFAWFTKVKYIQCNLYSSSVDNFYDFFEKPDLVIHLAWESLPNYHDLVHIDKNLFKNYKVIENFVKNGLKNIVVTGTCFEYGMTNGCLSEDMLTNPSNSYSIAKDTLRKFIEELSKNYDFSYKWIRLFYMYGKGQSEKSLLSLIDKAIENGEKEFNMSGGEQLRDYLPVTEVAKNIVTISQNCTDSNIINCCSGKAISIRKLVEEYLYIKKYSMKLNLGYYPYLVYEPMAFWGDNSKLQKIKQGN